MDNTIDVYLKKSILYIAPYFLSLYVYLYDLFVILYNQSCITTKAVKDSFNTDTPHLGFFKIENTYIPAVLNISTSLNIEPEWTFDFKTKTFTHCEIGQHNKQSRLPYIGASIIHNNDSIDLSEWINDVKLYAADNTIPLQLLAATWYYINNKSNQQ
jgi:hypothetical protein